MEYITLEKSVYEAMVSSLRKARTALHDTIARISHRTTDEWIDNETAQSILRKSPRSMQSLRSVGKIGYSLVEGRVFYPASEIGRILNMGYVEDE